MTINSVEEYVAAMARAHEMMSGSEDDLDEAKLEKIGDAVMAWYRRHDDVTAWV